MLFECMLKKTLAREGGLVDDSSFNRYYPDPNDLV